MPVFLLTDQFLVISRSVGVFQLPPKPTDQSQAQSLSSAPSGAYNPYSPAIAPAQPTSAPSAPLSIGFENLSSMFLHLVQWQWNHLPHGICAVD